MKPSRRILAILSFALIALAGIGYALWPRPPAHSIDYKIPGNPLPKIEAAAAAAIERREKIIDQTIWAKEMIAQEHGRVFEDFWDSLNASTNKMAQAGNLNFQTLTLGDFANIQHLPHQIDLFTSSKSNRTVGGTEWPSLVGKFSEAGWRLEQLEFRHNAFDPQTNDLPARSRFYFSAHLTNSTPARAAIEGDLLVQWKLRDSGQPPQITRIDATQLQIKVRPGPPAFIPIFEEAFDPPDLSESIEPLNVFDLDGDGIPEIILPALNRVYRRGATGYSAGKLFQEKRLQIFNGLFADFDGDGVTDFIFINPDGVFLLKGATGGKFNTAAQPVCPPLPKFDSPRALTCGDIDGDGDLDLFIGQYRGPFQGGNMPTPYYDANDSYPSSLLLNDGHGRFQDATQPGGLAPKRGRRVYGCSFVDLDHDGALDLVVTSDFAGVDVYRNDGHGRFTDVTASWLPESHAFGMAHAFGDFNNDGRLDFFLAGMTSPTAERLEHLGLSRPFSKFDPAMRARMIQGSRLYLADGAAGFLEVAAKRHVARSGWSWGVAAADFDNDGWLDLYVANGMESKNTVRDYETEFWLHDIFVADSRGGEPFATYFLTKGSATRGQGMSYGGFDKNRLFLNQNGRDFSDVAYLLGVGLEADCRNLVAADLDGDGKVDLAMTSIEVAPPYKQRLRIFRNEIPEQGNWIAFQFRDEPGARSPIGAIIRLTAGNQTRFQQLVTGASFRSQLPLLAHFGLGAAESVESVEIKRPGGETIHIARPEINRLNLVRLPIR